jgi:hypothetical protein
VANQKHHGRRARKRKVAHLIAAWKQRDRQKESEDKIFSSRHASNFLQLCYLIEISDQRTGQGHKLQSSREILLKGKGQAGGHTIRAESWARWRSHVIQAALTCTSQTLSTGTQDGINPRTFPFTHKRQ